MVTEMYVPPWNDGPWAVFNIYTVVITSHDKRDPLLRVMWGDLFYGNADPEIKIILCEVL